MNKTQVQVFFMALLMLVFVSGCSQSVMETSAKVIVTSQSAYDMTMKASADAYKQGIIGEEAKGKIIASGNLAYDSIKSASLAWIIHQDFKDSDSESKLAAAIEALKRNIGELYKIALQWGVDVPGAVSTFKEDK